MFRKAMIILHANDHYANMFGKMHRTIMDSLLSFFFTVIVLVSLSFSFKALAFIQIETYFRS